MAGIADIPSDWLAELGKQIREAREDAELTQQELADKLGVKKHQSVGSWEKGVDRPSIDLLVRMAALLETPFHIGQFRIAVTQTRGAPAPVLRKQNRLDYDVDYTCELASGEVLKVKPGKEGLLVRPAQNKSA